MFQDEQTGGMPGAPGGPMPGGEGEGQQPKPEEGEGEGQIPKTDEEKPEGGEEGGQVGTGGPMG